MTSLDEMKLETNWFLKKITAYNAQPNIGIDEHMVKLFYNATQTIADCVDQSRIVNDGNNNQSTDILFDIDESCYRYTRSIKCTICNINIEIKKAEYLAHVNGELHKRNLVAIVNGLQNGRSNREDIADAVSSAATLMMRSNDNDFYAMDNHIRTEEYFHVTPPTPRRARSSTSHSVSSFQSTTSVARDHSRPMSRLDLNGNNGYASPKHVVEPIDSGINNSRGTRARQFDVIRNSIKSLFPKAKVYVYGSHIYELSDERSDMNAYIDLDGHSYNLQRTKNIMAERQHMVQQKMQRDKSHWKNVMCDQRLVLYPLVRATSVLFGFNCTFSFGTGLFVEANYLIRDFINALPITRDMITFLKKWQHEIQQNESNTFEFSTYQMTILVIWYFQLWKYLPSVRSLQSSTNKVYCGDAQIDYKKPIKVLKPATNQLNDYLLEFFDFFGNNYNPRKDIISAFYGKLFKRNYTSDIDVDNWELCKYVKNANHSLWNEPSAHMYVHDVFLQSASPNVTANISSSALCAFRAHCKLTADFLRQSAADQ